MPAGNGVDLWQPTHPYCVKKRRTPIACGPERRMSGHAFLLALKRALGPNPYHPRSLSILF
ncbi:hypothetical protein IE53DRAFT_383420 [Violaceomyces palustris]|uniref:Uncharacterized protein n=1 Tax=Violaceomyces palustris TaxID=1673888 RepID=A0ACD0P7L9_9BASI|nr:hypothetical protein IE53DRAFT_383420 [Violaceomyces palustris]